MCFDSIFFIIFAVQIITLSVKVKDVIATLERFAPLPLQDGFDNAGLQIGTTEDVEISGVLLCLDVTEAVIDEAIGKGYNMVVSHHPLLFHGLKKITDDSMVERCVRKAIKNDIIIYSAHTNLDNARGGVNFEIAKRIGLKDVEFLQPICRDGFEGGSGIIGALVEPLNDMKFKDMLIDIFGAKHLTTNALDGKEIKRVALCGGAGDFLIDEAIKKGADAFVTGEMHYHVYFGEEEKIKLYVMGHYESEQYTQQLLQTILNEKCKDLKTEITTILTNPVC